MGKRSEDEQDRAKKVGPPFHKEVSPTKLMGFNASSFKGTLRTREEHWEQKVHLTKNTAGIHKQKSHTKPAQEIQRLKASSLSKAKAHGEHERVTGSKKCTSQKKTLCSCMTCGQCWRRNLHCRNCCGTNLRSWRNVLHGTADTIGAEDDFGLIQDLSTSVRLCLLYPTVQYLASSVVSKSSAIAVLLSLQLALQSVKDVLKFANVAPRWSLAELLFGSPRFHGFDDEAQDGLSLGVH